RACIQAGIAEITQLTATFLSRRDPRYQRLARTEARVQHAQWAENVLLRKLIERHSSDARDHFTERDESDVAVSEATAGRIAKRFFDQSLDRFVVTGPALAQIEVRSVT